MKRYFYLSRFIGDGRAADTAYRPKVSLFGRIWGFLDFRDDQTKPDGWCVAYLDSEDDKPLKDDPDMILLTDDPNTQLSEVTRERLLNLLSLSGVASNSLADILMEILLCSSGFKPNPEGVYELHLGGLLKALTEEDAMAFIGRLVIAKEPVVSKSKPTSDLAVGIRDALETVSVLVNRWRSDWFKRALQQYNSEKTSHPLIFNYYETQKALAAGQDALLSNHSVHWISILVKDLSAVHEKVDLRHVVNRLCDPNGCEPAKYELYVMAAYAESGATIEKTDTDGLGEFRVKCGNVWIYVECKHKSEESARERKMREVFESGTENIKTLMRQYRRYADIRITLSFDPTKGDLTEILKVIDRELWKGFDSGKQFKKGKNEILILPMESIFVPSDFEGVTVPAGYEYAVSEGHRGKDANGNVAMEDVWRIAWRSLKPRGWVASSLETFNKAADQLPKNGPGIIYLRVAPGIHEVVAGRMTFLATRIGNSLKQRKRVNALIMTGQALVKDDMNQAIAITRERYQTVLNKDPRTPLPADFKIFGRDFTRLERD